MTINQETPYGNLMTDLIFKRVFNPDDDFTKVNVINLINDILKDELECPVVDVVSRDKEQNPTGSEASRTSVLDLHCKDCVGRLFTVEIQIKPMKHFVKRAFYYGCQVISAQGYPGKEWDYDFKPVYTIAFSWFDLFPDDRFVHHISFFDAETKSRIGGFLGFTFIELKKFAGAGTEENPLWSWAYLFKNLHKLHKLPDNLDKDKYKRLLKITQLAKLSREELEKYGRDLMSLEWDESATRMYYEEKWREAAARGEAQGLAQGMEKGLAQGMEKGLAQGMAKGEALGKVRGENNVLGILQDMNLPSEQIAEIRNRLAAMDKNPEKD